MKQIGVIFEDNDLRELEQDAKENGRKLSQHVRFICLQYLKEKSVKQDAAKTENN